MWGKGYEQVTNYNMRRCWGIVGCNRDMTAGFMGSLNAVSVIMKPIGVNKYTPEPCFGQLVVPWVDMIEELALG